mmetsp:Transcript_1856/g.5404  ORF Transcript_1856/g.5404 Transcript_1856/m.5404 type:complete len:410 (-) Transcript_1856:133-1362(-)
MEAKLEGVESRAAGGVGKEAWAFRLRGPKGTPAGLELPDGGNTLLVKLIELAGKATRVARKKLIIRAGFPPRELECEGKSDTRTVAQLGLSNRDVLHVDRRTGSAGAASTPKKDGESEPASKATEAAARTAGPPEPSTPSSTVSTATRISESAGSGGVVRASGAASGTPVTPGTVQPTPQNKRKVAALAARRRRLKLPGVGRRLGDGTEPEDKGETGAESAAAGASLGTCRSSSEVAEHAIAADLITAAATGGGTVSSVHKALRRSMKEVRAERGAEADMRLKVAAALAGKASFRPLGDGTGRIQVEYSSGPRGAVKREVVTDIPPVLLPAILNLVASDPDPVSRNNMRVEAMSLVSPRMFWAVVRHAGVGPRKSFHEALSTLTPQIDWAAIEQRNRQKPERHGDYVSH